MKNFENSNMSLGVDMSFKFRESSESHINHKNLVNNCKI